MQAQPLSASHNPQPKACCAASGSDEAAGGAPSITAPNHAHHASHGHHGAPGSLVGLTTSATIHCLTGCAIGEFVGLAIGVTLGLDAWPTMALATLLGFVSGYLLGLRPLVKQGMTWSGAFKAIWIGETVSIAVMEFAMNFTDYHVGGVQASSVFTMPFWLGYTAALPAGFLAAWPVNYWLLSRSIKKPCH